MVVAAIRLGHDTFSLRLPFKLRQTHPLLGVDEHPPTTYDGLELVVRTDPLRKADPPRADLPSTDPQSYVIEIAGFPSAASAEQFLPRAWAGLTSLMLQYGAAYSTTFAPAEATAIGTDRVVASADVPVIYQSDKPLDLFSGGTPTVQIPTPVPLALQALTDGFNCASAREQFADDAFRGAVELYSATLFGGSGAAQLLLLSERPGDAHSKARQTRSRPQPVKELGEGYVSGAGCPRDEDAQNKAVRGDLEALSSALGELKRRSVGRSLPEFVRAELSGDADADEIAEKAVEAYRKGSSIRHGGEVDACGNAIADLRTILKRIFVRRLSLTAT